MKPTIEQEKIIQVASQLSAGEILKINAFAGVGKTQVLVMISETIIQKSLLLVFNKVTQLEATERFPKHVQCRTTHSLAYSVTGIAISHKLARPKGGYVNVAQTGSEIAKYLKISPRQICKDKILHSAYLGLLVRNVVTSFEHSAEAVISKKLFSKIIDQLEKECNADLKDLSKDILEWAKKLWKERIDPSSPVMASHDTYLKMYQLSNPILNYDVLYCDEVQDANPCLVDIISKQKIPKIIIVGDKFQSIYQFRGSVNAMEILKGKSLPLTVSFRYGQDSANLANKILENKVNIKSFTGLHTEVGENILDKSKVYTVLYRTNSRLILDAVETLTRKLKLNLEIDVKDFCNLLTSAGFLYKNDIPKVKHEELLCFSDWADFKGESKENKSYERIVKLVESGSHLRVINTLENHKNVNNPDVIFTTAHKSKGREWDQVQLADDYPSHIDKEGEWVGLSIEDQNLLYVATTRAKKALNINSSIQELLNKQNLHKIFLTEISKLERDYCDNFLED